MDIVMPKMGESVNEGTIIKWHKKVGDEVKQDEIIFEISTDKVDTEIPSPQDGTLVEILVAEQETVEVGTIIAKLSVGDGMKVKEAETERDEDKKAKRKEDEDKKEAKTPAAMHESFAGAVARDENKKGLSGFYSPLVLNIARKENVDIDELKKITGTGLEGRVTKRDILKLIINSN